MAHSKVALEHAFFTALKDGVFRKRDSDEPVFVVKLGDVEAGLPLRRVQREFHIEEDSSDGEVLALIARALDFVNELRMGDALPSEVLTGAPSWEVTDEHRTRAFQRLTLQLTTWLTGEERVFTGAEELRQIAEDPTTKKKVNEAFDEAARRLGFTTNGRQEVMNLVSSLADELAFIEALRDRFDDAIDSGRKIQQMRRIFSRENSVREIADAVARLMTLALKMLQTAFDEIDAQTGEIMSVLKNPAQQIQYIRTTRDNLYCRLFAWADILARWANAPTSREESNITLLRDTYRFLAPRYMPSVEWQLMCQLGNEKLKAKTSMLW